MFGERLLLPARTFGVLTGGEKAQPMPTMLLNASGSWREVERNFEPFDGGCGSPL